VGCVSFDEHAALIARAAARHLAVVVKAAAARVDCECLNRSLGSPLNRSKPEGRIILMPASVIRGP